MSQGKLLPRTRSGANSDSGTYSRFRSPFVQTPRRHGNYRTYSGGRGASTVRSHVPWQIDWEAAPDVVFALGLMLAFWPFGYG